MADSLMGEMTTVHIGAAGAYSTDWRGSRSMAFLSTRASPQKSRQPARGMGKPRFRAGSHECG